MTTKEKNQMVYKYACDYLKEILPSEVDDKDLEEYYVVDKSKFDTLNKIFRQMIFSAQNYQRMPNVIKFYERYDEIEQILHGFDYSFVAEMEVQELYQVFRKKFNIVTTDSKMNSWYKWSKSIIDSAKFINNFKDIEDFRTFVNLFDYNTVTRMSLPLLISSKISGIGFPLACDFLKELGYENYPKPDIHIVDIFSELGLSDRNIINVFEAVIRMYEDCKEIDENITPYKIDKILWLISSGRFYINNITTKRYKDDFIRKCKLKIEL